ncbi:MAG TPA: DMT family transporter [Thermoanaerobaculia bacterium]|nr:DMT family transporter [Thermoanaerobaculia bacterium]
MLRTAIEALLAILLFGCIPVVVKSISANPYTIGIFRLAIATLVLAAAMAMRGQLRRVAPRDLLRLAIIGLLFFGHWLTLFIAIKASSASIVAIGQSTYGVELLLLGALFTRERVNASDIVAVVIAAIGAVLVLPNFDLRNEVAFGMLLASLSALMYATLPLFHQRWSHLSDATRSLGQFGFALLYFLCFLGKAEWRLGARDWAGLLFLAIGVTLIGHSLWVRVTTRLPPQATSIIYYGNIPVAVILGVTLLHEPFTLRTAIGAMLIVGGSVFGLARAWRRHASAAV